MNQPAVGKETGRPIEYVRKQELHADDFATLEAWHHEGIGQIEAAPDGGIRLHCFGSQKGREGCMAFFRPTLPDHIAVEYDVVVRSHGRLIINYVAIRGRNGEDLIEDRDKLPPRTGVMADVSNFAVHTIEPQPNIWQP
jgi:hypothetical protein